VPPPTHRGGGGGGTEWRPHPPPQKAGVQASIVLEVDPGYTLITSSNFNLVLCTLYIITPT
jgi:hypothetical protein